MDGNLVFNCYLVVYLLNCQTVIQQYFLLAYMYIYMYMYMMVILYRNIHLKFTNSDLGPKSNLIPADISKYTVLYYKQALL
jgi:hypothetical protein